MSQIFDPYGDETEEQREAIARALFDLQLRLEDRRGYFTWMWVLGVGAIGWVWFKSVSDYSWVGQNGWLVGSYLIGGTILFIAGVALRINASIEMRHLKRLDGIAMRMRPGRPSRVDHDE